MLALSIELPVKSVHFLQDIFRHRQLVLDLTRREFRGRYLGSLFGLTWAFVHPAIMMALYWAVFQYGLKSGPVGDTPFVVWLLSGLIPWFFISESISGGSMAVIDNRFLVKKIVFRVSLLPVVRLLTVVPVHLFFLFTIVLLAWSYGFQPTLYCLQLPYYMAGTLLLAMGMSLLTSALVPFFRDLTQIVSVVLQIVFWLMPIVWPATQVPAAYRWILMVNPLYYIVRGYRESLLDHTWFWTHPQGTLYFWSATALLLAVGGTVFSRLRPHFADVIA
jgi:lipopolysaccharide transport system permease protein/teichoic acid transport system permease protein